jgi:prolyl oligopeptidase
MTRRALALILATFALALPPVPACAGSPAPPETPVDATVESFFGQTIYDPYRWLEETRAPEVRDWFHAQNDYARTTLDALPGRAELAARLTALDAPGVRVKDVQSAGNQYFYLKQSASDHGYRLYASDIATGVEVLLVDPESFDPVAAPATINRFRASPNGLRVAFVMTQDESDASTLHVLDIRTGKPIGNPIAQAGLVAPSWRFDSAILFYTKAGGRADTGAGAAPSVWMRTFGDGAPVVDQKIFGSGLNPAVTVDPDGIPSVRVSPVSPYAIATVRQGMRRELSLYYVPLTRMNGAATPWRKLVDVDQRVVDFGLRGEYIYLLTDGEAQRSTIVRWSLNDTRPLALAEAEVVLAPSERILRSLAVARDALYVRAAEAQFGHVLRLEYNVKLKRAPAPAGRSRSRRSLPSSPAALPKTAGIARGTDVRLPFAGSVEELDVDPLRAGALVRLAGWAQPPGYFTIDGKSGIVARAALLAPAPADWSGVTSTEVMVRSHDGVSVPLSIVFGRNAARDGSAPLLVEAYGAFGATSGPAFWPSLLAWLERGGVYAVAHVRGGGELGAQWHRDGTRAAKSNSWRDLIAAADWLVGARWTTPARLVALGRGAGAIAATNAMIVRPELFAAIVSVDGLHDTLRGESGVAGLANAAEFGSVTTAEGFHDLASISSYARLENESWYPAALLKTHLGNMQVDAWDAGKMAARMQAINGGPGGSRKPVLLRVGFAERRDTNAQVIDENVDLFAFVMWQTGVPGFAPQ